MREYKPEDIEELRILGRCSRKVTPLTLFWHGSGIEISVRASELWIEFHTIYESFEQWVSVWMDGALVSRQILPGGKHWMPVFLGADPSALHHVKVLKEIQPMTEDRVNVFQICRVRTDGAFVQNPEPSMKLEFIGDSITSGEGTVGAKEEMNWNSMVMGTAFAYPLLTANALDAEARMMSKGGWGVYSGYDGRLEHNIPAYYEDIASLYAGRTEATLGACEKHDFSSWQPDVVVVNLGTNDASAYAALPEGQKAPFVTKVKQASKDFLFKLRRNNPDAFIIWAYGSFPETFTLHIKDALEQYVKETGDGKAEALKFPVLTDEKTGSRGHPGREWHKEAAELLTQKIRRMKDYGRNNEGL